MTVPSENTLTVNNTHQMLSDIEGHFETLSVLSPSRRMENILGYDINLPRLKSVVFQYKRPHTVKNDNLRRFSIYGDNSDQWRTLVSLYSPRQAFFTLPDIIEAESLEETLNNTVFIDAHGLEKDTSLIYIPEDACQNNRLSDIEAKINGGDTYPVPQQYVYDWEDLSQAVEDCTIGLRVLEEGERANEFEVFRSRVNNLKEEDIDWIVDRIRTVAEEQPSFVDKPSFEESEEERLRQYLAELTDRGTDLSTYRIGRSRHAMLGW